MRTQKTQLPLLRNSDGHKSVSFTMLVTSFAIISLWLLLSIFESLFGLQTREFSGSEAMLYFSPIAMLYFGRRWKEPVGLFLRNVRSEGYDLPIDESGMYDSPPPPPAVSQDDGR